MTEQHGDEGNRPGSHAGRRMTRSGVWILVSITVVALAVAAMLLATASGLFGDIVKDPTAEKLPGGVEGANQAPAGQRI